MDRPGSTLLSNAPSPVHDSNVTLRCARVCIVTLEINGPTRNGGIGTGYTALAELLAEHGHQVTVLYLRGQDTEQENVKHWIREFQSRNITFVPLPESHLKYGGSNALSRSYRVYQWLREQEFDIVHFHEWLAAGYYSLLARHQGLAFHQTRFCVGTHSPTMWLKEAGQELLSDIDDLELDSMERRCVELSDVIWSPSQHLATWMKQHHWPGQERVFVQPYLTPTLNEICQRETQVSETSEFVFFGRLETRKGLNLFCDALDRLALTNSTPAIVTFLGKSVDIGQQTSKELIASRSTEWSFQVQILSEFDQQQALAYLQNPGRVAIMPSLMDNAPLALTECLSLGIPFIACATGGIPELIHVSDHDRCLIPPRADALAKRLREILHHRHAPARANVDHEANQQFWQQFHLIPGKKPEPTSKKHLDPLVSVCLVHHNRPQYLQHAIDSLLKQDYSTFEVIVVDDGSSDSEALAYLDSLEHDFAMRGWKLLRQENRYLGAARNTAARYAEGEYLLFMDDDNVAKSHEISTFVDVAISTNADIVTCLMDMFTGDEPTSDQSQPETRWLFAGTDSLIGIAKNCFGDANALIKRSAFESLGGFTEDFGVTHEDWELFAKAVLQGMHLEMIPEALFWYRLTPDSMIRTTPRGDNYARHLRPYLEDVPSYYRDLLRLAQGQALELAEIRNELIKYCGPGRCLRYRIIDAIHHFLSNVPLVGRLLQGIRKIVVSFRQGRGA